MKIVQITLIDGTVFKVGDYRFGGTIKEIMFYDSVREFLVEIREKSLHSRVSLPYHSVLFIVEKE
jgi:hypothetical protein